MPSTTAPRKTIQVTTSGEYNFAMLPDALLLDNVSDRAIRLFAVLLRAARTKVYPTRVRLAVLLNCSEDSVDRAITELCTNDWLEKVQHGRTKPNSYVLHPANRAYDGPSIDSMLRTREESDSAPVRTHDSAPVRTPLPYKRAFREVLPADSASQQERRPKKWSSREPDDNGEDAPACRNAPAVAHRAGSGAGLAAYFDREARKAFDLKVLGPRPLNARILAGHLKTWLGEGTDPATIKAMIDVYVGAAKTPKHAVPLWQDFLGRKSMLFGKAQKHLESKLDPAERYATTAKERKWES